MSFCPSHDYSAKLKADLKVVLTKFQRQSKLMLYYTLGGYSIYMFDIYPYFKDCIIYIT